MINLSRWIYSEDIAVWLAQKTSLDLEALIDYICAAPHRTLEEKLEGVKELKTEYDGKVLEDQIKKIEFTLERSRSNVIMWSYLFGIEIFYRGERDHFLPNMVFWTAKKAEDEICRRIETAVEKTIWKESIGTGLLRYFKEPVSPIVISIRKILSPVMMGV